MAIEKRLIDANALSERIGKMKNEITHNRGGYRYCNEDEKNEWEKLDGFDSLVCDAPTVDAVEVVRCKDCKHWNHMEDGYGDCTNGRFHIPGVADITMEAEEFCCLGERKADGKTD